MKMDRFPIKRALFLFLAELFVCPFGFADVASQDRTLKAVTMAEVVDISDAKDSGKGAEKKGTALGDGKEYLIKPTNHLEELKLAGVDLKKTNYGEVVVVKFAESERQRLSAYLNSHYRRTVGLLAGEVLMVCVHLSSPQFQGQFDGNEVWLSGRNNIETERMYNALVSSTK